MSWVDILIPEVHQAEALAILASAQIAEGEEIADDDVAHEA
jgi:hypothetical protein